MALIKKMEQPHASISRMPEIFNVQKIISIHYFEWYEWELHIDVKLSMDYVYEL